MTLRHTGALAALGALLLGAAPALASPLTVPVLGSGSIYNYHNMVSGMGSTSPTLISIPAGSGRTLTFLSVTGQITLSPGGAPSFGAHGPDGSPAVFNMSVDGAAGLSGIKSSNVGYLTGVFLNGLDIPLDPAPPTLDFRAAGLGEAFAGLTPLLNQVFFIGDGLTGTGAGATQTFLMPDSATYLALGFVDALGYAGSPGGYFDNSGSLSATLDVAFAATPTPGVPEPAAWALMIVGFGAIGAVLRRQEEARVLA